jgi:hypothetical protein
MRDLIKKVLTENLPTKGMVLKENVEVSRGLQYMVENKLPLIENIYRPLSDEYFNLINETRELFKKGLIELCADDMWVVSTNVGKTGMYEGEEVWLDVPFLLEDEEWDEDHALDSVLNSMVEDLNEAEYRGRKVKLNSPFRTPGGPKKFAVYVKNDKGNVVKVTFGDPNLRVRNNNPGARKSFRARHKCDQKKDRTKAGYWSCNVARYRKQLGIKSSSPW